jgi:hypothetical protein
MLTGLDRIIPLLDMSFTFQANGRAFDLHISP